MVDGEVLECCFSFFPFTLSLRVSEKEGGGFIKILPRKTHDLFLTEQSMFPMLQKG